MTPASTEPRPAIVAHRGYAGRYPENTLVAVEAALRMGVRHVEIDCQLTADGTPVLFHDPGLERTTGRPGIITDLTLAQLAALDAGEAARFGPRFRATRIPTLAALMSLLAGWPGARCFVEIKAESLAAFGTTATVDAVLRVIGPDLGRCVVISFDAAALHAARAAGARIGWVLGAWDPATHGAAVALAPDYLFCNHRRLPRSGPLWSGPWRWAAYEITTPRLALALARRGVDLVETMRLEAFTGPPWHLGDADGG